jgi:hypothetical protein
MTGLESRDSRSKGLFGSASFLYSRLAATLSSFCRWAVALTTPAARLTAFLGIGGAGLGRLNPAELSVTAKFAAWCMAISGGFRDWEGGWLGNSRIYVIGWASPACAIVRGAEVFPSTSGCVLGGGGDRGDWCGGGGGACLACSKDSSLRENASLARGFTRAG